MSIDTIPSEVTDRASAARERAQRAIEAEDAERAKREAEALERLRRQVIDAQLKLGARRRELERRREHLANVRIEIEQVNHALDLPSHPGTAVVRSKCEVHSVELGRACGCCVGDYVADYTRVHLASVRQKTTRNVFAVTPECMAHLLEQGLVEAAPEVLS